MGVPSSSRSSTRTSHLASSDAALPDARTYPWPPYGPGHGEQVGVVGGLDRQGVGHHRPAAPPVPGDQAGADALGSSGDDGDLARHDVCTGSLGCGVSGVPAILTPEEQRAVWFLGALIRVRAGGDSTGGQLAILEHAGPRGYSSPLHLHTADEETFFILDGDVRVEVGERAFSAGPGTVAFLPRHLPHAFIVTSHEARFLTLHTPSGFDEFTLTAGAPADYPFGEPPSELPDPAALASTAASFGIEILGPPPSPRDEYR